MSDRVLIQNSLLVVLSALELSCIGNTNTNLSYERHVCLLQQCAYN